MLFENLKNSAGKLLLILNLFAGATCFAQGGSVKGVHGPLFVTESGFNTKGVFLNKDLVAAVQKGVQKDAEESAINKCKAAGLSNCSVVTSYPTYLSYSSVRIDCKAAAAAQGE